MRTFTAVFLAAGCVAASFGAAFAAAPKAETQDYLREAMPAGIQVVFTEMEGPVFANAEGHTLYRWPGKIVRNGQVGDSPGKPTCLTVPIKETAGLMSIYPKGELLPDSETRPACTQRWPIAVASADAKPVGNFTIINRPEGIKQWAYKGYPLYASDLDLKPGDSNGARSGRNRDPNSNNPREVVAPAPAIPAQFKVAPMELGRMLITVSNSYSIYAYEKDTATKSNCYDACLADWTPVLAPEFAQSQGEWTVLIRRGGDKQWVFRGKPLYTHVTDTKAHGYMGSDVAGWSNVYVQMAPTPPKGFGIVSTRSGRVRTDDKGRTIYFYQCFEDSDDSTPCDSPKDPQVYRWAVCGGGDVDRCNKTFPYVIADKTAKAENNTWTIRDIDPKTGRYVAANTPGSLHVWAFRDRPIYTFAGDKESGDIEADSWGQDHGQGNGFTAFWVRDDFDTLDGGTRY